MIRLIGFILVFFTSYEVRAEVSSFDWEVCVGSSCTEVRPGEDLYRSLNISADVARYRTNFSHRKVKECDGLDVCWLFLGRVADRAKIFLNGQAIVSYDPSSFMGSSSLLIPVRMSLLKNSNELEIQVADVDGSVFGILEKSPSFGKYSDLVKLQFYDLLSRSLGSLLSMFSMVLFFLFSLISFLVFKSKIFGLLAGYCFVASLYLFSLSQLPRSFIDPVIAAGPLHFFLLILQAMLLYFVALEFFGRKGDRNWRLSPAWLYGIVSSVILSSFMLGVRDYEFYKEIIFWSAPLIGLPFATSLYLSKFISNNTERTVVAIVSSSTLVATILDILSFWQVVSTPFFIKWSLIIYIMMVVWVSIRRKAFEEEESAKDVLVGKLRRNFSHNAKIYLRCLKMQIEQIKSGNVSSLDTISMTLDNFDSSLDSSIVAINSREKDFETFDICEFFTNDLNGVKSYFEGKGLDTEISTFGESFDVTWQKSLLSDIFLNLLKNALDSKSNKVTISLLNQEDSISIEFSDNGNGVKQKDLRHMFNKGFTTKAESDGQGLGLSQIREEVVKIGGAIAAYSVEGKGCCIRISLPRSRKTTDSIEDVSKILIDDFALVRMSWDSYARKYKVPFKSYASVRELNMDLSRLPKDVEINIDFNLGDGKKNGIQEARRLFKLGFNNINLCTEYCSNDSELNGLDKAYWISSLRNKTFVAPI